MNTDELMKAVELAWLVFLLFLFVVSTLGYLTLTLWEAIDNRRQPGAK